MPDNEKSMVRTGEVRFSYVHLSKAAPIKGGDIPYYSVTLLIPKSDTETMAKLQEAMKSVVPDGNLQGWRKTIHDGDGVKQSTGDPYGPECAGCYVVAVKSTQRPQVADADTPPHIIPNEQVKSGDYGHAFVQAYTWKNENGQGVSFDLIGIQLTREGEPLGTVRTATLSGLLGITADDMFAPRGAQSDIDAMLA